ncbi:MOP flippase family protein [Rivularia sp. UHCC 0363]|uniref:MOP flippase family protein n=1 Tax=Rivularia sp. UHCC 0363 TaxID=3110244 RepID=UPI002B1FDFAA|nr:MOP flippase family protein [Rivularia sp. UHCC 0363]MEA5598362.1 MOP flippase family protein [Rivularia sp. UHCC 0363]
MSLKQKAIKGVIWSAVESWGQQAISFGIFFLLARLLGPESFGLVALASVFLAFVQVFLDQGLSQAIVQRHELEEEHLDTAFWTNISISVLLTTLSIACASFVANFYNEPQLTPIIRWLSLGFVFGSLSSVQNAILQRKFAFKALAIRSVVAILIGGLVGVTMAFMGFGVWSIVGKELANRLAQVLVLWWVSDWRPGFKISKRHFKELFSFGINVLGIQLLHFFNSRSDDFLIGYFLGSVALGYYTIAYRLLIIMTQLLGSVTSKVSMPTFSRLQQDLPKLRYAFYTATRFTSLASFPAFLGMSALAPELVRVLFGERWLPSIQVMQILAFIGILQSVYSFNGNIVMAMGKPSWSLGISCINAVVNVIGFSIAVRWGIVAVATSFVIRGYLLSPLPLLAIRKLTNIDLKTYFGQFISPSVASLGMVGIILAIKYLLHEQLNLYALLTLCIVIGTLVYAIIIALIAPKLFQQLIDLAQSVVPLGKIKKL